MEIRRRTKLAVLLRRLNKSISDYDGALMFGDKVSDDVFNTLALNIVEDVDELLDDLVDPTQEPEMRKTYENWCNAGRNPEDTVPEGQRITNGHRGSVGIRKSRVAGEGFSTKFVGRDFTPGRNNASGDYEASYSGLPTLDSGYVEHSVNESVTEKSRTNPQPNGPRIILTGLYPAEKETVERPLDSYYDGKGGSKVEATGQPRPSGKGREITPLVIRDLLKRSAEGKVKYGEALKSFNGRSALHDAYEESLDQSQYLRQAIDEWEVLQRRLAEWQDRYEKLDKNFRDLTERYYKIANDINTPPIHYNNGRKDVLAYLDRRHGGHKFVDSSWDSLDGPQV